MCTRKIRWEKTTIIPFATIPHRPLFAKMLYYEYTAGLISLGAGSKASCLR
jgi:hypothetical protein